MSSLKRNKRTYWIVIPLLIVLTGATLYEYGFLNLEAERKAIVESEAARMKTLEKNIALIAQKPRMENRLSELKQMRSAQDAKLIEGQTVALAAANLQSIVRGLITGRGGSISTERVEKPEDRGKFTVICISIDTILPDAKALSSVLYTLETQTPSLAVRELDVRIMNYSKPRELMAKLKVTAMTAARS